MQNCRLIVLLLVSLAGLCMLSAPALARDIFIAGDSTASVYGPKVFAAWDGDR
jgi:hypothetical protein